MPEFRPGVVSIMIPTYNQAAYIGDTIRSVLAQTYTQLEIIVADDASTDETPEIVAGFADPRIKYFRNERNIGRHIKVLDGNESADYESPFRLMLNNKLIHLDRIIGVWRRHGDNLSTNLNVASWIDNLELFSSVRDYAKKVLPDLDKGKVDGWFRRNSVNYARRMVMRALRTANTHLVAAVLKRVWKRDRAIFLLTLFSPVTMLVMFRKALTRIVHRFAAGNRA